MLASLKGWKTVCIFAPIFVLSFLDGVAAIDLKPVFDTFGVLEPNRAFILCAMSLLTLFLRAWTTTPVGTAQHPTEDKA